MDTQKITLEQLKAIAYDLIANKEDIVRKLQMINNEIANFKPELPVPTKEEIKKEEKK